MTSPSWGPCLGYDGRDMEWLTTSLMIDQLKAGDELAWATLVARFRRPVFVLASRLGLTPAEADDVCQETLLAFLDGLRRGNFVRGRGRLSSWLFGIASMKVRQTWDERARRAREKAGNTDGGGVPAVAECDQLEIWDLTWQRNLMDQALARVPLEVDANTWRAFTAVQLEGRVPADVAVELGMTRNAVFIAKHRVLKRLRVLLKELDELAET